MKQRLTLDKVNAAIGDMAAYAEANAQLIAAPRKKVDFTHDFISLFLSLNNPSILTPLPLFFSKWLSWQRLTWTRLWYVYSLSEVYFLFLIVAYMRSLYPFNSLLWWNCLNL